MALSTIITILYCLFHFTHCQSCTLQTLGVLSSCHMSKLESMDNKIAENIKLNVIAGVSGNMGLPAQPAIIGDMPVVGSVIESIIDGTITSVLDLFINKINTDMNTGINELKQCLDNQITFEKINYWSTATSTLVKYFANVKTSLGDAKITNLDTAFTQWNIELPKIFQIIEGGNDAAVPYENMLPIYKALYPLYQVIAAEEIMYLIRKGDYAKARGYQTGVITNVYNVLDKWIRAAAYVIPNEIMTKATRAGCGDIYITARQGTNTEFIAWKQNFENSYIKPLYSSFTLIIGAYREGIFDPKWITQAVPPNKLQQVAIPTYDGSANAKFLGHIVAIDKDNIVYIKNDNEWIPTVARLTQISGGKTNFGIGAGMVWEGYYKSTVNSWGLTIYTKTPEGITWWNYGIAPNGKNWKHVSIGSDGIFYGITMDNYEIYLNKWLYDATAGWVKVSGNCNQIDVDVIDKIWCISTSGSLYFYDSVNWRHFGNKTPNGKGWKYVTSSGGATIVIGDDGKMWYGSDTYGYWQEINSKDGMNNVAIGYNNIWAIDISGNAYKMSLSLPSYPYLAATFPY